MTPVTLAVVTSLFVAALVISVAVAIGGSYLLTLGAINVASANQQVLRKREVTAQLRSSIPTCKAIVAMDNASRIPKRDFPWPPHNTYDRRLSAAIHRIDTGSRCPLILRDLARGMKAAEIVQQLERPNASSPANRDTRPTSGH